MGSSMNQKGYFSILRWRPDATRDEAKNVAVILVDKEGQFGGVKSAPLSTVSPRLREQGILDSLLVGLGQRFSGEAKPDLTVLTQMHSSLERSLCITEPQAVAVPDVDTVLNALYRAYVAPRGGGGSRVVTKGKVLDQVVSSLRTRGYSVRRGDYMGDFMFDVIVEAPQTLAPQTLAPQTVVVEVLSFATSAINWVPVEHDAGHFLYALERVDKRGLGVIEAPSEASHQNAWKAHERVLRWFEDAKVDAVKPSELAERELTRSF